jgi:hypothetical protein
MAGSAAVLLATGTARAAEQDASSARTTEQDTRTVAITVDASGFQRGNVPAKSGEQVRLVFTRTAGPEFEALVLPEHGILAPLPVGQPVMVTVRSAAGGIGYTLQPLGELGRGAPLDDKAELEAGNSGGRG